MMQPRMYEDGAPCTNAASGCTNTFHRHEKTSKGQCRLCYNRAAALPNVQWTKPCECGCGKDVEQRPRRRRFYSRKCAERVRMRKHRTETQEERIRERLERRLERHPAMKYVHMERLDVNARGLSHLCMYCEVNPPMRPGGDRCDDQECKTRWHSDYAKGRREVARANKAAIPPKEMVCACPCRRTFTPRAVNQKYYSVACERTLRREKRALSRSKRGKGRGLPILFGGGKALPGRAYAAG